MIYHFLDIRYCGVRLYVSRLITQFESQLNRGCDDLWLRTPVETGLNRWPAVETKKANRAEPS